MRHAGLAALLAAAMAAGAEAQLPRAISPRLARAALQPDTDVVVWVVARPTADLDRLAATVRSMGGRVRHVSRFVHAVSAVLSGNGIVALAGERDVERIQPVGRFVRGPEPGAGRGADARARRAPTAATPDTLYGAGSWVVRQLNVQALHELGLRGAGVRIAMLDAGFDTGHPLMAGARIVAQRDFVYGDSVVRDEAGEAAGEMTHGTQTWSLIAANAPGRLFGLAPEAEFLLAKTEFGPTETRIEEDHWVAAVEWAESLGVDIISSSLGYLTFDDGSRYAFTDLNGDVAVTTVAADSAARRGTLVVVAVGNDGPQLRTLGTPADADSALAVGATDSLGRVAGFSSRGPTADNRIKPELVAPGVAVPVAAADGGVALASGTSFSTPLVAGLAALVQGARPGRPALALRQGLIDASSFSFTPDSARGYGVPDGLRAYAFPTGLRPLGPTDSALATLLLTFGWDAGEKPAGVGADTFRLKVGADSALAELILDTTLTASSVTLPVAPRPGTRLFWRVTARSPLGVAESTAVRGPFVVPPWVTLLTLNSPRGHSIRDSLPVLVWQSPAVATPPGPFAYDVAVYPGSRGPSQAVAAARGLADTTFRPALPLERNLPYRWQVVAHLGARDSVIVTSPGTFVVLDESAPPATLLFQNFPNPFPNPALGVATTCIWFDVAEEGRIQLDVFDLRGRLVRRLAPAAGVPAVLAPGRYGRPPGDAPGTCDARFAWDGRDDDGAYVRPGVYLYRLTAPRFRDSRRVVFMGAP